MELLAELLEGLNIAPIVNAHGWVWPVCEIFHFMGMALLIGSVGMLDLRILGLGKGLPIAKLERLVPIGVAGFAMNALTGLVFVAGGGPLEYFGNLAFLIKMLLILLAGVNVLAFYATGLARAGDPLAGAGDAVPAAKVVAGVSLALWFGVIFFGRMIMYNDTLLYTFGL